MVRDLIKVQPKAAVRVIKGKTQFGIMMRGARAGEYMTKSCNNGVLDNIKAMPGVTM